MSESLVKVRKLTKYFPVRTTGLVDAFRKRQFMAAVNGISFDIRSGEILGLAGESGCGKTTTGRLLVLLETPTNGDIIFDDVNVNQLEGDKLKFRRNVQMIFQDPYDTLDPRYTIRKSVLEVLNTHYPRKSVREKNEVAAKVLQEVELTPPEVFLDRYPHELSGGQRQRVAIAIALCLKPKFIVADEPVSMLDVSMRAGILDLMVRLKREFGLTYLFITHDVSVARYICNRIAVMYLGRIVEIGPSEKLISDPIHPYAKMLISAVPVPDPTFKRQRIRTTEIPNPADIPTGCSFHPRCRYRKERCSIAEPELLEVQKDRFVACFEASELIRQSAGLTP